MAATEHRRVCNRIATAGLESAKMLKENQHRTASNTKLSLKMEGHDHGTTKKKRDSCAKTRHTGSLV
jgi:hypothetical protein